MERISLLFTIIFVSSVLICLCVTSAETLKSSNSAPKTVKTTTHPPSGSESKKEVEEIAVKEDDVTDMSSVSDPDEDRPEFSIETFITISVTVMIVLTNCAIIMVAAWTEAFSNFNKIFLYSLTLADLLVGLFITPYSIFLSVYRRWVFESEMFCSVEAYVYTTLCVAKLYSLTWLNVDHYVAVRKPERYNVMMSPARSLCWIAFSWVVAISFCCPPLFSFESAVFNNATYICMIDSKQQIAYMLTAGVLASLPSLVALVITNAYLFTTAFKQRIQFYEKVFVELSSRPRNYHITFVMCSAFLGLWFPFLILFTYKQLSGAFVNPSVQFYLCWFGMTTSFSQFFVLLILSQDFRHYFLEICQLPDWCHGCFPCCGYNDPEPIDVNVISLPKKQYPKSREPHSRT